MYFWEISSNKWIYVYHYARSYLLTKELSFRGIYSSMDSLCSNYKQNAIVFMDLDNFRFHSLCSDGVYKFAWLCVFEKSQSLSEYMYGILRVHIYVRRNFHLDGSTHCLTACVKTISNALLCSLNYTNFVSILVFRWCM